MQLPRRRSSWPGPATAGCGCTPPTTEIGSASGRSPTSPRCGRRSTSSTDLSDGSPAGRVRSMNDYRAASMQGWSSVAADWAAMVDVIDRQLAKPAAWMIADVAPGPGDRVLELAGGPGTLSMEV